MQSVSVFSARCCLTGLLMSAVLITLLGVFSFVGLRYGSGGFNRVIALGIPLVFGAVVAFLAVIEPSMKYTVTQSEVIPSCGPFRWRIPISEIRSIVERNLSWLPWADGWKIPGYALFTIRYGDVGTVRMCATSMTRRVLVIETDQGLWGITPQDEEGFIAAVESRRRR
jgi:hypothetical protein